MAKIMKTSSEINQSVARALSSWRTAKVKTKSTKVATICVWGANKPLPKTPFAELGAVADWQWREVSEAKVAVMPLTGAEGPLFVVNPWNLLLGEKTGGHMGQLEPSVYALGRDALGAALSLVLGQELAEIKIYFMRCREELVRGALVGMDLAAYQFRRAMENKPPVVGKISLYGADGDGGEREVAAAANLARHMVNLPGNMLNPVSMVDIVRKLFGSMRGAKVEIWGPEKLRQQRCNLMLAVGEGSATPPQLVIIRHRPKKAKGAPIAFVGKGVTFDTGGLNIKPDSAMRWMKKDMGGAAAVLGLAWWVVKTNFPVACDFYLALAENAIGSRSFRPGDVFTARSGLRVEIQNTDAEGRLVLADAMNVAVESKPRLLIDVATLTGAIKASLGSQVAGLFGNDDKLVKQVAAAGRVVGEPMWPMPLFRRYKGMLKSTVADMANSSDGFGGAVTAALFLEAFVGEVPWAHLDIYAWRDGADGALTEAGGNGQPVQALIEFLKLGTPYLIRNAVPN